MLGTIDCILQKHNEKIIYCDTDSAYCKTEYVEEIVKFFDPLIPYDNVEHLLKKEETDVWFYGISAKRYVLYTIDSNGDFVIKDEERNENYSLHGLGHLANPFGENVKHWQKEIWLDILRLEYKGITENEFLDKYRNFYAVSQFTVSTSNLMRRFKAFNNGKAYDKTIRPMNFFLIGFCTDKNIKPIAPFSKDAQSMPYGKFIDYRTGNKMKGQQYFKSLADELFEYIQHPESKLAGSIGMLQRRHLVVDKIVYVGKEADKIEESMSGLGKVDVNIYNNLKDAERVLSLKWKDVRHDVMSRMHFQRLKKRFKEGKLQKLGKGTIIKLQKLVAEREVL
jgi:hypothetical protein